MDQNNGDNHPMRIRAHSKLGSAGIDRCMAGIGAQEADGCGVVSWSRCGVVADRIRSRVIRVGAPPGASETSARAQAFS